MNRSLVAQICNLLYRRIVFCRRHKPSTRFIVPMHDARIIEAFHVFVARSAKWFLTLEHPSRGEPGKAIPR